MEKLKFYLMTFIALFLLVGCEDEFIDLNSRDDVPEALILNSSAGLEATMFQVFETARAVHENMQISMYKQCGTDLVKSGTNLVDVTAGGMLGMNEYSAGLSAVSPEISDIWDGYYESLNRCSRVIAAADILEPETEADAQAFQRFKGEASAMRAYLYLELVQRFDNIPLATLLEPGEAPSSDAPLQDKAVIYEQIISDCNTAIELLEPRVNTAGVGAPSKGLAYHLLSKAHLDLGNWAEAAAAAESVIGDDSYSLQPLDNIFGLDGGKTGEESNNEIILSWVFDPAIQNRAQRTSQMYVPLYDRINGVLRTMESGGRAWSRLSPSDYYFSLFDEDDGRLEAWHKLNWEFDDPDNLPPGKELGDIVTEQDVIDQFGEGSIQIRYIEPTTTKFWEDGTYDRTTGEAEGFRNIIVYRYSEAFLIGAEAHMRNGNMGRALELINTIRDRAYGDSNHRLTSIDEESLLEEHARELGHEGHRWAMLKRLGLLVNRVQAHNPSAAQNIEPKHVRWPLPQAFVDLARVNQNEGY